MSELLEKSKQSKVAADLLMTKSLYSSSINRYYYSYVQFMLHITINKLGHDRAELDKFRKEKEGSHQFASRLINSDLAQKDFSDYKWFQQKNQELKQYRVLADYSEVSIPLEDADKARTMADSLINLLKKNFK